MISQAMDNVRNPSGTIMARSVKIREKQLVLGPPAVQWIIQVVQIFCNHYGVSPWSDAFQMMQTLTPEQQFEVCSVSLEGARNAQAVLFCRIQKLAGGRRCTAVRRV